MPRLNPSDKLAALRKQAEEIQNQIKTLSAREKEQKRKEDTRRKVIAGALALEHMTKNPQSAFAAQMRALLTEYVEPRSVYLFPDLIPTASAATARDSKDEITARQPQGERNRPAPAPTEPA